MDYIDRNHQAMLQFLILGSKKFDNFAFPLKSTYKFDVIALMGDISYRIKIICTESKRPSGSYVANLLKSGGYEIGKEKKEHFKPENCDFLFVWTPEHKYLIHTDEVTQIKALTLSKFEHRII